MPGLLIGFIALLLAIHAARSWISPELDLKLVLDGGFISARLSLLLGWAQPDQLLAGGGEGSATLSEMDTALARYVASGEQAVLPFPLTYALLHGSWTHVVMNSVWLAAFGTPVIRRCGNVRSVLLALATAAGGALGYWVADPLSTQIVIGASGIASGFMGAAASFVFEPGASMLSGRRVPEPGGSGPIAFLRNRNAVVFLAVWFAVNLAVGWLGAPLGLAEGGVAWQAHIGGLLTGLLVFPLLVRRRADPPA